MSNYLNRIEQAFAWFAVSQDFQVHDVRSVEVDSAEAN